MLTLVRSYLRFGKRRFIKKLGFDLHKLNLFDNKAFFYNRLLSNSYKISVCELNLFNKPIDFFKDHIYFRYDMSLLRTPQAMRWRKKIRRCIKRRNRRSYKRILTRKRVMSKFTSLKIKKPVKKTADYSRRKRAWLQDRKNKLLNSKVAYYSRHGYADSHTFFLGYAFDTYGWSLYRWRKSVAKKTINVEKSAIVPKSISLFYNCNSQKDLFGCDLAAKTNTKSSYILLFSDVRLFKISRFFYAKVDCFREFVKLHDRVSYDYNTFTNVTMNKQTTNTKTTVSAKRTNSLFIGRFAVRGLREKSLTFYAKAVSFVFMCFKLMYWGLVKKLYCNYVYDANFLSSFLNVANKGCLKYAIVELFKKNKVDEKILKIFHKNYYFFNIHNGSFFLKSLHAVAPVYSLNLHRTDRKKYKSSKGKLPKWMMNWVFISKNRRISHSLRYIKLNWRIFGVNTFYGKYAKLLSLLLFNKKRMVGFVLSQRAMTNVLLN